MLERGCIPLDLMTYVAKLKRSLFLQVLCALFLGIAVGLAFHDFSLALKPLGDGFISLIKMLIAQLYSV